MSEENVYKSEESNYNVNSLDSSKLFVGSEVLKTLTIAPVYQTTCEIAFHDYKNNKDFRFTPQEDITAFELSHVLRMWLTLNFMGNVDVSTFLKENGIERHFTEK
jgi:hypothetical protein